MTDEDQRTFDLAVLGAGSAGMAAAKRASEAGLSVVQFEGRAAGGTCVNRGCVPKKLLVQAARQADALSESAALGWTVGEATFEWSTLREKVHSEVRELSGTQRSAIRERGVHYVEAEATFAAADTLRTADGETYRARHVVVATGARPLVPDLPGAEHALVSDDLFTLDALPERIAMIGGGYIAVEFACLLHRFGVEVTIIESGEQILEGFEPELVERLQGRMRESGIAIELEGRVARIESDEGHGSGDGSGGRFAVELESGERHAGFDAVALVIGRAVNTDDIGLEAIGVELDDKGQVPVDGHGRTGVDGVFAIGDVARTLQLTPVAIADGRNVVDGILGRPFEPVRPERVPAAVYATPQLGSVGLDEAAAEARGIAFDVRRATFSPLEERLLDERHEVIVKLLVERGSGTLLGFHMLGGNAAESAQLAAVLLEGGATEGDLYRAISLHPTDAEEIVGLGRSERERGDGNGGKGEG